MNGKTTKTEHYSVAGQCPEFDDVYNVQTRGQTICSTVHSGGSWAILDWLKFGSADDRVFVDSQK